MYGIIKRLSRGRLRNLFILLRNGVEMKRRKNKAQDDAIKELSIDAWLYDDWDEDDWSDDYRFGEPDKKPKGLKDLIHRNKKPKGKKEG